MSTDDSPKVGCYSSTVLYIHGSGEGPSEKAAFLKSQGFDLDELEYDYRQAPQDIYESLREQVVYFQETYPKREFILVGSSLGGFFAFLLGKRFHYKVFLINPCLLPSYSFAPDHVRSDEYRVMERELFYTLAHEYVILTALLEEGDQRLPFYVAYGVLRGAGRVKVYPGGSHSFSHRTELVEELERAINEISYHDFSE
jgi:predicted esterase YcpF (UPF0227 family)